MANNFNCPACGTTYSFKISKPLVICCPGCGKTYTIHQNSSITDTGHVFKMPEEISLIRLGVKGTYSGLAFEIVGRIKSVTTYTSSNKWLMWFEGSGSYSWLAENNLTYFVYEPEESPINSSVIKSKKAGSTVEMAGNFYQLTEIAKQLEFYMQGELPEATLNTEHYYKIELSKMDVTQFATICIYEKNDADIAYGKLVSIKELGLSNINEYKDWL